MKLLNILNLLTLNIVIRDHPTRLKTILTILKSKLSTFTETIILFSQISVHYKKKLSTYSSEFWSCLYNKTKRNGKKSTHGRSTRKSSWLIRTLTYFFLTKATKITRGPTTDVSRFAPEFMLQMDLHISMLKASVNLTRLFWIYALLLHTPLDLQS